VLIGIYHEGRGQTQNRAESCQGVHTVDAISVEAVAENNEKHWFDPLKHFEIRRLRLIRPYSKLSA